MESVDIHGRSLTTNPAAASWYRRAQGAPDRQATVCALRTAIRCDPGFAVAASDLEYLASTPSPPIESPPQIWERHHIEIVRTALADQPVRARDLLNEHLAEVGCDPIAAAIAPDGTSPTGCHPPAWTVANRSNQEALRSDTGGAEPDDA